VARHLSQSDSWELELATMTRQMVSNGGYMARREVADWWRYRHGPGALVEGNRFALEGLVGRPVEAALVDTRIQGNVSIHPSAQIESSIVRGPAIIGERARLRDAYVGPYTSIGEAVIIEGAEIEHSIILPGASISHLGGRLEASIVGPKARVFRDFRLPKALRLNVGEGAEVSLA
jgi:glucose-1-phosphate thymidylyltransferase